MVKVTPAHDPNDYATGLRHNLEQINLLTPDGKVNENGQSIEGGFNGKKYSYVGLKFATEARKRVLADLEGLGLIAEKKPHEHEVGHSDRSKTPIEPYLSDQWFVRMGDVGSSTFRLPAEASATETGAAGANRAAGGNPRPTDAPSQYGDENNSGAPAAAGSHPRLSSDPRLGGITLANGQRVSGLAQAAMDAVTDGRVKITPDRYAKGYLDWLGQKRDWCISRQLWWGHRIPVWSQVAALPAGFTPTDEEAAGTILPLDSTTMSKLMPQWANDPPVFIAAHYRVHLAEGTRTIYACVAPGHRAIEAALERDGYTQDPNVLDTWFSSALWPLSTMGWPNSEPRPLGSDRVASEGEGSLPNGRGSDKSSGHGANAPEPELLPAFYPTSVLSTARDILTLWVARMVMFGLYCRGDVPFHHVYVHPVIQDGEGKIMSKSKGNGVDPVDIIGSHGADALRFTLTSLATETQDIRMPVVKDPKTGVNTSPKFDLGRNFANKIWNASRFILGHITDDEMRNAEGEMRKDGSQVPHSAFRISHSALLEDRWILSRLNATIAAVESAINAYHFADYAQAMYQFFWTDLCDWYLEIAKGRIKAGDAVVQSVLLHCIRTSLKLLHPVMPFITEEIWSKLPGSDELLVVSAWPKSDASSHDAQAEAQIAAVQAVTRAIRDVRNQYAIPPGKTLEVTIKPGGAALQSIIAASRAIIEPLANATLVAVDSAAAKPANAATAVLPEAEVYVAGVIDKEAEAKKLTKRREELQKFIAGNSAKLANEGFTAKAPAKVVQGLRDQLAAQQMELAAVEKNLAELS